MRACIQASTMQTMQHRSGVGSNIHHHTCRQTSLGLRYCTQLRTKQLSTSTKESTTMYTDLQFDLFVTPPPASYGHLPMFQQQLTVTPQIMVHGSCTIHYKQSSIAPRSCTCFRYNSFYIMPGIPHKHFSGDLQRCWPGSRTCNCMQLSRSASGSFF